MKRSFQNEVMKKEFLTHLKEAKGFSDLSLTAYEHAIVLWQDCTQNKDFAAFGIQQVRAFKQLIKARTNEKGERLSLTYLYNVMRRLKGFFIWLSMQPHYKSKINGTVIDHLSLTRNETRIALQPGKRDIPSMEEVIKVSENIKIENDVDRRNRALICFTLLTGARISAIISLPMMDFDEKTLTVYQNPNHKVKTKFSKCIQTTFFPIKYIKAAEYFVDWYRYLKNVKGFKPTDPIFPMTKVENGEQNISYHNTGEVVPTFWKNANSARKVFQKCFLDAGIPYYHPHTFRHLVVSEFAKIKLTEEEKKAISQNLGHEHVGTTFGSYGEGHIEGSTLIEIVKKIKIGDKEIDGKYNFTEDEIKRVLVLAKVLKEKGEI